MRPSATSEQERRRPSPSSARAEGFDVVLVPPFTLDGREVRSSEIRTAIAAGDLATAERLLGRPYAVSGDASPRRAAVAFADARRAAAAGRLRVVDVRGQRSRPTAAVTLDVRRTAQVERPRPASSSASGRPDGEAFAALGRRLLPSAGHKKDRSDNRSCSEDRVPLAREAKQEIITGFATKDGDTGSPEVQIALLTERIRGLTEHLAQLSQGQPLATRPPQARRPAPSPSCLSDQEGQHALPRRHRTARTPPLAFAAPGPRDMPGSRRVRRQQAAPADAATGRSSSTTKEEHSLVSDIRDTDRWSNADHRDGQARPTRRRRRHRPLRRHPRPRDGQPVGPAPGPRLLPAHRRVRGADVRRGQDPGRVHQA